MEVINIVNWYTFIRGEAELKCESLEDAQLLLDICKENRLDYDRVNAEDYKRDPYWYIKDDELHITRYSYDDNNICSSWTVNEYVEEHTR